ncbi:MAG: NADH dehydrogenase [Lentisphaerae bacterium GWF2_57_35]|nr:MAG: NADH dehydrogenase [Lentisphaerae bacterium GWF2_57_35]
MLAPQEIVDVLKEAAGDAFKEARCTEWAEGVKGNKSRQVWIRLDRKALRPALKRLIEIHFPHLGVISCTDLGEEVELLYHLFVYYGVPHSEIMVTLAVSLPKTDLSIPTITDLIPGALVSEREKQEMMGIRVENIPDGRRMFLPDDFPEGVYPWRKDATGIPSDMVKELWTTGRENLKPPEGAGATEEEKKE